MTNTDLTLHRERLLALRARLQGDMTQMEDNALNKDHSKTTSMPNDMAELGTGNFDQELTLSLLGSENDALDQIEAAMERIEDGSYGQCETCGRKIPRVPPGGHPLCGPVRPMCLATGRRPRALIRSEGYVVVANTARCYSITESWQRGSPCRSSGCPASS